MGHRMILCDEEEEELVMVLNSTANAVISFLQLENERIAQISALITLYDSLCMIPRGVDLYPAEERDIEIQKTMEMLAEMPDDKFQSSFRLNREEFAMVVDKLDIHQGRHGGRLIHPPEIQLALTLRYLSDGSYLDLSLIYCRFTVSTFYYILHRTIALINASFDIKFPCGLDDNTPGKQFRLPGCVGAVDGILIPITMPPKHARSAFWCRKGFYALNMQAVVDANCCFTYVHVKWAGPTPDSTAFKSSTLYTSAEAGMIPNLTEGRFLAADSAYPLRKWMIKPYDRNRMVVGSPNEIFNKNLSSDRVTVERAFGMLVDGDV